MCLLSFEIGYASKTYKGTIIQFINLCLCTNITGTSSEEVNLPNRTSKIRTFAVFVILNAEQFFITMYICL